MFSGSAKAEYARYMKDDHYSRSSYYLQTIYLPTEIFMPSGKGIDVLEPAGVAAYEKGSQHFRDVCGNKLINEMHQGVTLAVTLKIRFSSHQDKENFEAHASATFGEVAKAKASIKSSVEHSKSEGSLEFSAYQLGGDASQLAKVFGGKCDKGVCLTSCGLSNLDACDGVIDGVLKYAQDDLPKQIKEVGGSPLWYSMQSLTDLDLEVGESVVTPAIAGARKNLGQMYINQKELHDVVEHAIKSPCANQFDKVALEQLIVADSVLKNNVKLLESGGFNCYSNPGECVAIHGATVGEMGVVALGISER